MEVCALRAIRARRCSKFAVNIIMGFQKMEKATATGAGCCRAERCVQCPGFAVLELVSHSLSLSLSIAQGSTLAGRTWRSNYSVPMRWSELVLSELVLLLCYRRKLVPNEDLLSMILGCAY